MTSGKAIYREWPLYATAVEFEAPHSVGEL
jgi:hypothetical protein